MPESKQRRKETPPEIVVVGSVAPKTGDKSQKDELRKAANAVGENGKRVWWNGFRAVEVD